MGILNSGWHRLKEGLADDVENRTRSLLAGHEEREAETLRQLTDVFKELANLFGAVAEVQRRVDELAGLTRALDELVREIRGAIETAVDIDDQSSELLGRLLASTRARLEVVEEAVRSSS